VIEILASRLICAVLLLCGGRILAQPGALPATTTAPTTASGPSPVAVPLNKDRILKVIPNYQTVEDSNRNIAPMTSKEKWHLAWKCIVDPFNIGSAAVGAGFSQAANDTPKYGRDREALAKRFGAAIGDFSSQELFSTGIFATLLHQDPRYFRRGPRSGLLVRVAVSLKQVVVARQDSGAQAFNASNILGVAAGIGLSNLYYPSASRTGTVMRGRVVTSLGGDGIGNLVSEFWPDIRRKYFSKRTKP
jgi:hypothetical protein